MHDLNFLLQCIHGLRGTYGAARFGVKQEIPAKDLKLLYSVDSTHSTGTLLQIDWLFTVLKCLL